MWASIREIDNCIAVDSIDSDHLNEGGEGIGCDTEPVRDLAAVHGTKDPEIVTFAPSQVARTTGRALVQEQT